MQRVGSNSVQCSAGRGACCSRLHVRVIAKVAFVVSRAETDGTASITRQTSSGGRVSIGGRRTNCIASVAVEKGCLCSCGLAHGAVVGVVDAA